MREWIDSKLEYDTLWNKSLQRMCLFKSRISRMLYLFFWCRDRVDLLQNACFVCFGMFWGFQRQKCETHRQVKRHALGMIISVIFILFFFLIEIADAKTSPMLSNCMRCAHFGIFYSPETHYHLQTKNLFRLSQDGL